MLYSARKVAEADNIYATIEPSAYLSLRESTRGPHQYIAIRTSATPPEYEYSAMNDPRVDTNTGAYGVF